jgi:hypothetical protein
LIKTEDLKSEQEYKTEKIEEKAEEKILEDLILISEVEL